MRRLIGVDKAGLMGKIHPHLCNNNSGQFNNKINRGTWTENYKKCKVSENKKIQQNINLTLYERDEVKIIPC